VDSQPFPESVYGVPITLQVLRRISTTERCPLAAREPVADVPVLGVDVDRLADDCPGHGPKRLWPHQAANAGHLVASCDRRKSALAGERPATNWSASCPRHASARDCPRFG